MPVIFRTNPNVWPFALESQSTVDGVGSSGWRGLGGGWCLSSPQAMTSSQGLKHRPGLSSRASQQNVPVIVVSIMLKNDSVKQDVSHLWPPGSSVTTDKWAWPSVGTPPTPTHTHAPLSLCYYQPMVCPSLLKSFWASADSSVWKWINS